ncbi:MAG: DNA methyltransferase [bacterium]
MKQLIGSRKRWWRGTYPGNIYRFHDGEIVCDDALAFLDRLRPATADIVFLDPPFNLGKKYGTRRKVDDRVSETLYFYYMTQIILSSVQVLKQGGALYLYHVPKWATRFAPLLNESLDFRHWIALSMKNGFRGKDRLTPAHYALLYYTKGRPGSFKRPKIQVAQCRHCNKPVKDYGGYQRYIKDGVNLSDFWEDLSPVRHRSRKHRTGNELPMLLTSRIVSISGRRGGLLVDPFAGTGTSLIAARSAGMQFIACDKESQYLSIMIDRLQGTPIPKALDE